MTGSAEPMRAGRHAVLTVCLAALLAGCATPSAPWPDRVVRREDMTLLTRMPVRVLYNTREVGSGGMSTVVLRVHVDALGKTQRAVVQTSSGVAELDEAALNAVRDARFAPYQRDGVAEPVTLMLPMHFPLRKRTL
jgi:protein TonB